MLSFNYKGIYYLILVKEILFVECSDNVITIHLKHDFSKVGIRDEIIDLCLENEKDCMMYLELIKNKLLESESGFTL